MPDSTATLTPEPPVITAPVGVKAPGSRIANKRMMILGLAILAALIAPHLADAVWQKIMLQCAIVSIGAIGLNLLVGLAGQLSVGQGALLAVGAYTSVYLTAELKLPFLVSILLGGALTAIAGTVIGLPSIRIKGLYLVMATLAGQLVIKWIIVHWTSVTGGTNGRIGVVPPNVAGFSFETVLDQYYFVLVILIIQAFFVSFLGRTSAGRAWALTRDAEHIAGAYGQGVGKNKLIAFTISSFMVGVAGALFAHTTGAVNPDFFGLDISINYLIMIVIGGLGTVTGAIVGAVVLTALPEMLNIATGGLGARWVDFRPYLTQILSGLAVIAILVIEPGGLTALANHLWRRVADGTAGRLAARKDRVT